MRVSIYLPTKCVVVVCEAHRGRSDDEGNWRKERERERERYKMR